MNATATPSDVESLVISTCSDGVITLWLNNNAYANALSAAFVGELTQAFETACNTTDVHTLVFRTEGKHLSSGFDTRMLENQSDGDLLLRFVKIEQLLDSIWTSSIRTVAVATGRTWGAGADLFAACGVRVALADASFRFPGAGFGLLLGTRRLLQRVGRDKARDWVCNDCSLTAAQAFEAGLANAVCEPDTLDDVLQRVCQRPSVAPQVVAAVNRLTLADSSNADLADLVRSAAHPGLSERIAQYRQTVALRAKSWPAVTEGT